MQWMQLLNPLNWIKLINFISAVWGVGAAFFRWVSDKVRRYQQKKDLQKLEQIEQKIEEANKIEDDTERLKKKSEAANELENSLHPGSN